MSGEKALITTTFTVIRGRIDYGSAARAPAQHDFNRAVSTLPHGGLCRYNDREGKPRRHYTTVYLKGCSGALMNTVKAA